MLECVFRFLSRTSQFIPNDERTTKRTNGKQNEPTENETPRTSQNVNKQIKACELRVSKRSTKCRFFFVRLTFFFSLASLLDSFAMDVKYLCMLK